MASSVKNICTKNYSNLSVLFQITVDNVGDAFLCIFVHFNSYFVSFVFPGSAETDIR